LGSDEARSARKQERRDLMEKSPATDEPLVAHSYSEGSAVLDAQGEKVGVVGAPPLQGNYLVVEQGWLFTHTLYIPHAAIHAQDANGIYLNLTKEELQDEQWKVPPGGGTALEAAPPTSVPQAAASGQEADPLEGGILPGPLPADPLGKS
jgi:hypothetical protein